MYYDKDGTPLDVMEWGKKIENRAYKRVAETTLPDGKWVSTVWLGLDHGFHGTVPLIFETMVFSSKEDMLNVVDMERYPTTEQAEEGHKAMVAKHQEERENG